jgi:hypothetical protein
MVSTAALAAASSAGPFQGMADGKPSVALQDRLSRCASQLAQWRACPLGKNLEGKQIIENLQTQIRRIESKIADIDNGIQLQNSSTLPSQRPANIATSLGTTGPESIGRLIDAFA